MSAPTLITPASIKQTQQIDNEIEIIGENFPLSSSSSSTTTSVQNKLLTNKVSVNKNLSLNSKTLPTDEKFKEYLSKNYNTDLSVACKPQCNFVSNISCIDQCIQQSNYYENYLKSRKL